MSTPIERYMDTRKSQPIWGVTRWFFNTLVRFQCEIADIVIVFSMSIYTNTSIVGEAVGPKVLVQQSLPRS